MGYKAIATKVETGYTNVSDTITCLRKLDFESIWSGSAENNIITNVLSNTINNFDKLESSVASFVSALNDLDTYKKTKEKITSLKSDYNSLADTKENRRKRRNLSNRTNGLISDNKDLRKSIVAKLEAVAAAKISPSQITIPTISYDSGEKMLVTGSQLLELYQEGKISQLPTGITTTDTYTIPTTLYNGSENLVINVNDMLKLFQQGRLTKIPDGQTLYDYVSREQVYTQLNSLKNQYSGRYLAANSALSMMTLAANNNLKLDYDWGGGHTSVTSLDHVAAGTDCSAFVSWAVNQGSVNTFGTRTTSGLINVGRNINYANARVGDIMVYNNGDSGHAIMIIENHPEQNYVVVAEANGSNTGVVLQTRKYSSLKNQNYSARDMSEYYGENTVQIA